MYNTARSFTHESTTYVIRRLAFLNLGFISCTPLPSNLLSHHFWVGHKVLAQPQTQELLKCRKGSVRFSALPSVCAQRRACATIPCMTLFFYNPEMLSAFSAILSEREASKREFLNNFKTIFFSLRLAGRRISRYTNRRPSIRGGEPRARVQRLGHVERQDKCQTLVYPWKNGIPPLLPRCLGCCRRIAA